MRFIFNGILEIISPYFCWSFNLISRKVCLRFLCFFLEKGRCEGVGITLNLKKSTPPWKGRSDSGASKVTFTERAPGKCGSNCITKSSLCITITHLAKEVKLRVFAQF